MIFIITLLVVLLLNFYIILFGTKDIDKLKSKICLSKYIDDINTNLKNLVGGKMTIAFYGVVFMVLVLLLLVNILSLLQICLAIIFGTYLAKKLYDIPKISNVMNKVAVYINRLKK